MEYLLLIILFFVAVLGHVKDLLPPSIATLLKPRIISWSFVSLAVLVTGIQIFLKLNEAQREREEFDRLRPKVSVEGNYFGGNKFAIIIRTPDNEEIIDLLTITFVERFVVKTYPRGNIIDGEPCIIKTQPYFSVNGNPIAHKVNAECRDVRRGSLNGFIVEYRESQGVETGGPVDVEWYWKYKGQTKRESMQAIRKQMG